jgi:glucosyl-dolichyl phosphate glucuronosyltransferase
MTIRISAVIPTFNRARYLRKAISSLVEQSLPKDQYEIIVVDNCSTDDTRQIVHTEFSHVGNLRYVFESQQGLNHARNTGWRNASGEFVAYLDDDAIACSDWLERILERFNTYDPKPGCVGGRIAPIWESSKPAWLADNIAGFLAIADSDTLVASQSQRVLAGANMAVRKDLLEAIGGFEPRLDRKGDNLMSNGDSLLQLQVIERSYSCLYDPQISVRHHIQSARFDQGWFIRRMYWEGVSESLMYNHLRPRSFWQRLHTAQYRFRQLFLSPHRSDLFLRTDQPDQFERKCFAWREVGRCAGLLWYAR